MTEKRRQGGRRRPSTRRDAAARTTERVAGLLRAATEQAVQLFIDTANDPEVKLDVRLDCARLILERVYGKAAQPIGGERDDERGEIIVAIAPELDGYAG